MKMNSQTYAELKAAVLPVMEATAICSGELNERRQWDCLWRSGFDVGRLYFEGLSDNHINTALHAIVREESR